MNNTIKVAERGAELWHNWRGDVGSPAHQEWVKFANENPEISCAIIGVFNVVVCKYYPRKRLTETLNTLY